MSPLLLLGCPWISEEAQRARMRRPDDTDVDTDTDTDTDVEEDTCADAEVCGDGVDNDCDGTAGGCAFPSELDIGEAPHHFDGGTVTAFAGWDVDAPGDVDGDGQDDLVVGVPGAIWEGVYVGAAYILHGPLTASGDLPDLAATALFGTQESAYLGLASRFIGDTDGDGYADLAVAEPWWDSDDATSAGRVHFLRGPIREGASLVSDPAETWFYGYLDDGLYGASVVGGSDLDGQGDPDVAIGQPGFNPGFQGEVFVDEWTGATPTQAALIYAEDASTYFGFRLATADTDGDGAQDLLVSAPNHSGDTTVNGAVYVLPGPLSGTHVAEDLAIPIQGARRVDYLGTGLCGLGDVDGDGREDFAVASRWVGGQDGGAVYLVLGASLPMSSVEEADATFTGPDGAQAGWSVDGAGDLDGDGTPDLLVGAGGAAEGAGAVYIVPLSERGAVSLDDVGTHVRGDDAGDQLGQVVAGGGDLDGDGLPDAILTAPFDDGSEDDGGRVYLLPGIPGI